MSTNKNEQNIDATSINATNATNNSCVILEEPVITPKMLAYYHPIKPFTEVWFDQTTEWYNTKLVQSGIQYPKEWFMISEIPDEPFGLYTLFGSMGGYVTISGKDSYICRISAK